MALSDRNPLSHEWDLTEERGGRRTGKTVWQIRSDEPTTPGYVADNGDVPVLNESYPDQNGLPMVKRTIRPEGNTRMIFRIECEYDSTLEPTPVDPLDAPVKVSIAGETSEQTYFEDKQSTPKQAKHPNGVVFAELPTRDKTRRVISFEKNVPASKTMADFDAYEDSVNTAAFTIDGVAYAPRTLKCGAISLSDVKTENGVEYRVVTGTLRADKDTWDQKFEALGTKDKDNKPKMVTVGGQSSVNENPWPLNEDGTFKTNRTDKGFEIVLKPYAAVAFAALGIA